MPLLRVSRKLVQKEFRVYLGLETLSCSRKKNTTHQHKEECGFFEDDKQTH